MFLNTFLSCEIGNKISMDENNHFVYLSKKNIKIAEFILAYFSWRGSDRDIKNVFGVFEEYIPD